MWRTAPAGQLHQLGRRRGGAEHADGSRACEIRAVVGRVDRFGDLALDFEPDQKRLEKRRARRALPSATASAAASAGTVGWVSSPNVRSGVVESCVSS